MEELDERLRSSIVKIASHLEGHAPTIETLKQFIFNSTSDVKLQLLDVAHFGAYKHKGQTRSYRPDVPYFSHPIKVAALLRREGGIEDTVMLAAALLHDTIEDTRTSKEELENLFGKNVAALVEELTLESGIRLEEELLVNQKASPSAKIIRLADRTHNLRDFLDNKPVLWPKESVENFLLRSYHLLRVLKGTHKKLEEAYESALESLAAFVPKG